MNAFNLSFVIVAHNEEKNIARCLDTVMAAAQEATSSEIILVDSLSQDDTVAIAQRYPIKILQLHPEQRISSWAARFVGLNYARGELVQFIDGDMALQKNWLTRAAPYVLRDGQIVAVIGRLNEIYVSSNGKITQIPDVLRIADEVRENPRWVGGAMLCHRERLQRIDAFNPFLYGEGEAEMCFRAELHRRKILALPISMVEHYSAPRDAWRELRRKFHNKMYLGFGQALRYHCTKPQVYKLLLRRRNHALALGLFFLGIVAFIAMLVFSTSWPVLLWFLSLLAYFASLCLRYRSMARAFFNLATKALFLIGTVRGFFIKPHPVESFSKRAVIIKDDAIKPFANDVLVTTPRSAASLLFNEHGP